MSKELVDQLNASRFGTLWEPLGIRMVEAEPDRVVGTMPVGPATRQQYGMLHGGATLALAETVASVGTVLNIDRQRQVAVGLEINANHLRPKFDGMITAEAIPLHRGRTTMVWDIKIRDEQDRLIAVSRCTIAVLERTDRHGPVVDPFPPRAE